MVKSNTSSHCNMDRVDVVEVTVTEATHRFYCDECGDFIMSSKEADDGYYNSPKKFYINHIHLKGDYCKKCGEKKIKETEAYLKSVGFDI